MSTMLPLIVTLLILNSPVSSSTIPYTRSHPGGVDISLSRRQLPNLAKRWDGDMDLNTMFTMANCTRVKYNYTSPEDCKTFSTNTTTRRSLEKRQRQSEVLTTDWGQDVTYTGSVSFGSPAQTFEIVLDTGSSDLWVQTTECMNCPAGSGMLNTGSSSSIQMSSQSVQFSYGQGQAQGTMVSDSVSLGDFNIETQTFGAVTQIFDNVIPSNAAGIMGLGFRSLARTGATPFWEALLNRNQLSNPEFSFYLARNEGRVTGLNQQNPGGSLTLGGRNTTLFQGDIDFQNFPGGVNPAFWWQDVASLTLNGNSISYSNGLAAIDTGTTLLAGPQDAVTNFWNAVPGSQSVGNGMFSYPCGTTLNVSMSFGGKSFPINPVDLNFGRIGGGQCIGAFFSTGSSAGRNQPAWIVGDVFLKNVYTIFRANPPSVGFAELSDAAGGSSGTPGDAPAGSGNRNQNGAFVTKRPSVLLFSAVTVLAALLIAL